MTTETLIILLPLVALALAALSIIGLWYWWASTREEKPEGQPSLEDRAGVGLPPDDLDLLRPSAHPGATLPPLPHGETLEVLRVLRDVSDGSLVVEIGGRRYRSLREIDDPQVGRRFMADAQALARFAQLDKYAVPETWSAPAQPAAPAPSPPLAVEPPRPPQPEEPPLPRRSGLLQPDMQEEIQPEGPLLSMPEQIEAMLQERLERDPALAYRSIHIRSAPDGGVRVEVDGRYYEGVGDVQDDEVRRFIQETIREWEARQ